MRNDKNAALKFRLQGKSYNEIIKLLSVPKSILSGWFTGLELSKEAKNRIQKRSYNKAVEALIKRNKYQTHLAKQNAAAIHNRALKEVRHISKRDLFIWSKLVLGWGL